MLGGGDDRDYDYEIFSPAYLENPRPQGLVWGSEPPLDPVYDAYALDYDVEHLISCNPLPLGQEITKVVLMAACSVTHHSDMHQRYVELSTVVEGGVRAYFRTPTSDKQAPRGLYMLFVVTNAPSVSEAIWVRLWQQ